MHLYYYDDADNLSDYAVLQLRGEKTKKYKLRNDSIFQFLSKINLQTKRRFEKIAFKTNIDPKLME